MCRTCSPINIKYSPPSEGRTLNHMQGWDAAELCAISGSGSAIGRAGANGGTICMV